MTVTTNSFDAAFGGLGGAQVNQISRSGGNQWHGNLLYLWNGRAMNANSWFNKFYGTPSPRNFDNANQWAASVGGPLRKNKIFGFIDTEGIRVIIPKRGTVYAPGPDFQAAILGASATDATYAPYGNLAANGLSAEAPVYQTIFRLLQQCAEFLEGSIGCQRS